MKIEKNVKILLIVLVSLLLIVLGTYFFNKENKVEIVKDNSQALIEKFKKDNFGDLAKFIKDNLSGDEVKSLKSILVEKDKKIADVKMLLKQAFEKEDGQMEKAFGDLANVIREIKESILPFVKVSEKNNFEKYFMNIGAEIEVEYIQK
jgi:regulatory protein YycI of two-component signal transduction system YycFG